MYAGEYFVVGMDIEQYDSSNPEKYLMGLLHSEQEPWVGLAYQSYLAVLPSPLVGFDDFAKKVRICWSDGASYHAVKLVTKKKQFIFGVTFFRVYLDQHFNVFLGISPFSGE